MNLFAQGTYATRVGESVYRTLINEGGVEVFEGFAAHLPTANASVSVVVIALIKHPFSASYTDLRTRVWMAPESRVVTVENVEVPATHLFTHLGLSSVEESYRVAAFRAGGVEGLALQYVARANGRPYLRWALVFGRVNP